MKTKFVVLYCAEPAGKYLLRIAPLTVTLESRPSYHHHSCNVASAVCQECIENTMLAVTMQSMFEELIGCLSVFLHRFGDEVGLIKLHDGAKGLVMALALAPFLL